MHMPIPDADGAGVTDTLSVAGLPETAAIEAVVLEISVDHSYASDLGVTITSPAGTSNVVNPPLNPVLDHSPGLRQWRLLSNAFYGEAPNGEWQIKVADLAPADEGALTSWRLRFHYGEH
jgi:aminopeptidase S